MERELRNGSRDNETYRIWVIRQKEIILTFSSEVENEMKPA